MTVRSLLLGTCCGCGKKCDKRAVRCAGCRWERQRAKQGPHRFWAKVDGDGDCWLWTGYLMRKNYGQYRSPAGKTILAHRMAWELTYGSVPDDLCVLHACDEPRCVRPDHLFLGTLKDNSRDMANKGRQHLQRHQACKNGHPYSPDNTRINRGCRQCLTCLRAHRARTVIYNRAKRQASAKPMSVEERSAHSRRAALARWQRSQ